MKNAIENIQVSLLALTIVIISICLFPLAALLAIAKILSAPTMPRKTG